MKKSNKLCECGCGKYTKICQHTDAKYDVIRGQPNKYLRGHAIRKHGHTTRRTRNGKRIVSPEYAAFQNAKKRCQNPKVWNYYNYGGRGIEFRFISFEEFLQHLGKRPSKQHSLDRYPNKNGHYEIGNVRWATVHQQSINKRAPSKRNRLEQFTDSEIREEFLRRKL